MTMPEKLGDGKYRCPECGKDYKGAVMGGHLRTTHGIYGGVTGRLRKDKMAKRANQQSLELVALPQPDSKPKPLTVKVSETMRVAIDQDGGMWIMEKIR